MMNKPLFLFVGKSASGKTSTANILNEKYGYTQIWSYTTRWPRYQGEPGHIFISDEEFDALGELAAYTLYNGYRYGTTIEQVNDADIYVVDVPGVQTLLEKLQNDARPICILYFDTTVHNRIIRMKSRGDSDTGIVARLSADEKEDWLKQLDSLVWHYNNIIGKGVDLYTINANNDQKSVVDLVLYYMNKHKED